MTLRMRNKLRGLSKINEISGATVSLPQNSSYAKLRHMLWPQSGFILYSNSYSKVTSNLVRYSKFFRSVSVYLRLAKFY